MPVFLVLDDELDLWYKRRRARGRVVPVFLRRIGGEVADVKSFLLGFGSEGVQCSAGDEDRDAAFVAFRGDLPGFVVSFAGHGPWSHQLQSIEGDGIKDVRLTGLIRSP